MKVAFIGVGNMGARMARRVIEAGLEVRVCDRPGAALAEFEREGIRTADTPSQCADADLIVIMVTNDDQVLAVALGENGISAGMRDHVQRPIVAIMSTVLPETVTRVRLALEPLGARVIDAPVSGGLLGAAQGTLTFMVGGSEEDIERANPVLNIMGSAVFHCGPAGAGQVAKIVNNMVGITNLYLAPEAFQLARTYNVDPNQLASILESSSGRNFTSRDMESTREQYAAWGDTEAKFFALGEIVSKDLQLAKALARDAGLQLPMLDGISEVLQTVTQDVFRRWQSFASRANPTLDQDE
jgi:3-hydroxyisobutyrate dehydrogenase